VKFILNVFFLNIDKIRILERHLPSLHFHARQIFYEKKEPPICAVNKFSEIKLVSESRKFKVVTLSVT
jgi:hypothetical protein